MRFTSLKMLSWILLATVVVTFSACKGGGDENADGSKTGDKKEIKIAFIVKQPEDPWFKNELKFAAKASKDLGFKLLEQPARDGEEVRKVLDNMDTLGVDGIVICTPDPKLGSLIKKKTEEYNMKLMTVDDRLEGKDGKPMEDVAYLGISAHKIGMGVGESLWNEMQNRKWPLEGTAVCAVTWDQLETTKLRTDGAIEKLIELGFPKDQVVRVPLKDASMEGARQVVTDMLTVKSKYKRWLVCANNDPSVAGAVRAMEKAANFDHTTIIGVGINGDVAVDEFKKSEPNGFWGSMLLQANKHGYDTCEMMYKWIANDEKPAMDTRTVGILITRENWEKVYKEQGLMD